MLYYDITKDKRGNPDRDGNIMGIKRYLRIVLKNFWIIIIITAIACSIVYYLDANVYHPLYASTSTLYVMSRQATPESPLDSNTFAANKELLQNYKEIIMSSIIADTVIKELSLNGYTTEDFLSNLETKQINATSLLEIKVINNDPQLAKRINDSITDNISKLARNIDSEGSIYVIGQAVLPSSPISPNKGKNMLLAIIAGIIGGLAIIFMIDYFDDSIKSTEELRQKFGLEVLGLIPKITIV